jgi:biopolymer transport protein ExbB/TolQ
LASAEYHSALWKGSLRDRASDDLRKGSGEEVMSMQAAGAGVNQSGMGGIGHTVGENRGRTAIVAVGACCLFIFVCSLLPIPAFQADGSLAKLLFGHLRDGVFQYPFTAQNLIEIVFALGLGELWVRWKVTKREEQFLSMKLLPEDPSTVLTIEELGPIVQRSGNVAKGEGGYIAVLINLLVLQLQANRSVDQAVAVMSSSLDIQSHRVEVRYALIRYIVWIIPTLGFVGTVTSMAGALGIINPTNPDLGAVVNRLSDAFLTTALALVESAILVLLLHLVGSREEEVPTRAAEYCLTNLINRLYIPPARP